MDIHIPTLLRIKPDAIKKIGTYVRSFGFSSSALFFAPGIRSSIGDKIIASLALSGISTAYEVERNTNSISDTFREMPLLPPETDVLIAVGGGRVIDYVKYLSLISSIPMIAVPTIISNDGFASPLSSLVVGKTRKSISSTMPAAVIIDTAIIANSPLKYIYSGIGDMSAKYTAIEDWRLAFYDTGLKINDFAKVMSLNAVNALAGLRYTSIKEQEFIQNLASGLLISGMAIQIAGSTRPASGSEHLISHAYDSCSEKPSIHGLQVGVAALAVSFFYPQVHERVTRLLQKSGFIAYMQKNPLNRNDFLKAVQLAPSMKPGFHSILSVDGVIQKLSKIIVANPILKTVIV